MSDHDPSQVFPSPASSSTDWFNRLFLTNSKFEDVVGACSSHVDNVLASLRRSGHFPGYVRWSADPYLKTKELFDYIDRHQRDAKFIGNVEKAFRDEPALLYLLQGVSSSSGEPPLAPTIFGREAEVDDYVGALRATPTPKAIAICGTGGIGKTALALNVLHHPDLDERFRNRRYFVTCENISTVHDLVSQLVEVLIVRDRASPFAFDKNLNNVIQSLAALLSRQSALICCLDNFETVFDKDELNARALLRALLKCQPLGLIVTMRGPCPPVADGRWYRNDFLGGLELGPARLLFESDVHHANLLPHSRAIDEFLTTKLGGHPLALKLIAHQVTNDRSVVDTFARYEELGAQIMNAAGGDEATKEDSLVVSLLLSYEGPRVTDQGRLLFRLLSYLPFGVGRADIKTLLGTDDAVEDAKRLTNAALITVSPEDDST